MIATISSATTSLVVFSFALSSMTTGNSLRRFHSPKLMAMEKAKHADTIKTQFFFDEFFLNCSDEA
jgi:hypothetical protein